MRLLVLAHALPPHRAGGLEQATAAAVGGLAERGHQVRVLTTSLPSAPDAWDWGAAPNHVADIAQRVSVELLPGASGHPSPRFWRAAGDRAAALRAGADPSFRPDAILAVDLAGVYAPAPFLLQMHGTLFSETPLDPGFAPHRAAFPFVPALWRYKGRLAAWPLYRRMLRRAWGVLADSEFIRDRLARLGPAMAEKTTLVHLALAPSKALRLALPRPAEPDPAATRFSAKRPLRLLSVGRLATIKGHETVAAALREIAGSLGAGNGSGPSFVWSVAGPPSHVAADLPPSLRNLEGEPWFRPLGALSDEALAEAYRSHDFLLNMEFNQPAFGLVALEAMAAGCCPIASDRGALPELLRRGTSAKAQSLPPPGDVVRCGDAAALAYLLRRVYEAGPAALRGQAEACRLRAADFSFDRWIGRLEGHLSAVAALSGPAGDSSG